ncbi:MAG: tetratricopeptide repeat protein, partial [Spirochaetales bacterium]|nr:tetratricopeptide repeat protein [Spirochaetales bacterium]
MGWLAAALFLFPLLAVTGSDRDLFDEGERRFAAGNYVLAIDRFERLLQDHPGSEYGTRAQFRIAQSRFYLEEYPAALERLQRTAARARGGELSRAIRLWIGLTEFQVGDYQRADDALTRYLDEEPSPEGRAFLYRGLARLELGRTIAAVEDLVTAIAATEGVERSYAVTVLMEIHSGRGSHAETLALYDRWISSGDEAGSYEEAQVRYAADAAYELDDTERAVVLYRQLTDYSLASAQWAYRRLYAIAQDRQDRDEMQTVFRAAERRLASEPERLADFWYSLGADAFDSGRDELAELYLSRVWEVRRQRTIAGAAPFLLARSIERQGRGGEALQLLLDSLEDAAVAADFALERRIAAGRLLVTAERFDEAAALLDGRDELETDSSALYIWGFALYRTGESERVASRLERDESQALIRELPALALLRARILLERGDAIAAVRAYRTYLAGRPEDDRARVELVRALVGAAQFASASQEVERIDASVLDTPTREELTYLRGLADFHEGMFEGAVESLRAVTDSRYEPARSYHLAWSLYRLGETGAARETIAAVVDDLPPALRFDGVYLYAWTLYQGGDVARSA